MDDAIKIYDIDALYLDGKNSHRLAYTLSLKDKKHMLDVNYGLIEIRLHEALKEKGFLTDSEYHDFCQVLGNIKI